MPEAPTRAIGQIVRAIGQTVRTNVITRFNILLGSLLLVILLVGPLQDALFGVVLVSNALVGIVQEISAKRILERLALINAPTARLGARRRRRAADGRVGDGGAPPPPG